MIWNEEWDKEINYICLFVFSAVSGESGVPRSASDVVQLSTNRQRAQVSHSASADTTASGAHNAAFTELAHSAEITEEPAPPSALLKYINEDIIQKDDENTGLLENSSYFASSSAFGGPADMNNDDHSSSSSLISSNFDSQDERSFSSSEEEEDYDDSVVVESSMWTTGSIWEGV